MWDNISNINTYCIPIDYKNYPNIDFSKFHLSLDTYNDFILLKKIYQNFKDDFFTIYDILEYINYKNLLHP